MSVPKACLLCQQPNKQKLALCQHCYIEYCQPWGHCLACDKAINNNQLLCGACLKPKHIVISACHYHSPLGQQISGFKKAWNTSLEPVLSQLLSHRVQSIIHQQPQLQVNALIPIPSHPSKLLARGFNPAWEVANNLAKELGLPLWDDILFKSKATQDQAGLDKKQRQQNLQDCFSKQRRLPSRNIALVDDVYTTGTTISAAAKALGINKVTVYSWARARAPK